MAKTSSMWERTKVTQEPRWERPPTALITGVGGQDGSYLARYLLKLGYVVHGVYRRSSVDNLVRVRDLVNTGSIILHMGDLSDPLSMDRIVREVLADEVYHLADQDCVRASKETPAYSMEVTLGSVERLLESLFIADKERAKLGWAKARTLIPISATVYGSAEPPQSETTPYDPQSPYAVAKLAALHVCRYYRNHKDMHVSCGIMFNHDSPVRGSGYLLQKVCRAALAQKAWDERPKGDLPRLKLTNLDDVLDIGFAGDFVEAMHGILRLETPDDFSVGTGQAHSLRYIVRQTYGVAGVRFDDIEPLIDQSGDPNHRPETLICDRTKLTQATGWEPKTSMVQLLAMILDEHRLPPSPQESMSP